MWDKVFESGLSKFCERKPLKNVKGFGLQVFKNGPNKICGSQH